MTGVLLALLRQHSMPRHLLGRVSGAFGIIGVGTASIRAPMGGLIAKSFGLSSAIITAGVLCVVAAVMVAFAFPADDETAAPAP